MADTYEGIAGPTTKLSALMIDIGGGLYARAVVPVDETGEFSGGKVVKQVIPTMSASPDYAIGEVLGGIQTITSASLSTGKPIKLTSVTAKDKTGLTPAFTLLFFSATPSGGTYTDNAALVLGSGDLANLVGAVKFVAGDWYVPVAGSGVAAKGEIGLVLSLAATSLFMLVIMDSTWNAASTSDLQIELGIER